MISRRKQNSKKYNKIIKIGETYMATRERSGASRGLDKANTLVYKGYIGVIEYDDDAGIFHGEVVNLRDVITFQGTCVDELRQALIDSVEDYLEFCADRGEEPEKPFSGNLPLRIDPELHRKLYISAKKKGVSINRLIGETLEKEFA